MENENTALFRRWFKQVWEQQLETAIDELGQPDLIAHGVGPEPIQGAEAFKQMHRSLLGTFHDLHFEFMHMFAEGDFVSGLCEMSMTHTATGAPTKFLGNVVVRVVDGRIAEGWNTFNFLDMLEQLGTVPAGSFASALT